MKRHEKNEHNKIEYTLEDKCLAYFLCLHAFVVILIPLKMQKENVYIVSAVLLFE